MDQPTLPPLSYFYRYLWEDPELMVVVGDAGELFRGMDIYNRHFGIAPVDDADARDFKRLLTAAGLAAVSLSDRESWGWNLSLPDRQMGFFVAAEPEGMLCGCLHPTTRKQQLGFVQRQKAGEDLTQSHFTPQGSDVVHAVERYFVECEQVQVRVAANEQGLGALVRAMPGGRLDELASLSDDELIERCRKLAKDGEMKGMGEVLLFYECRCDDEMILSMITNLPADQREELWRGQDALHIECPRCGRGYTMKKQGLN